MKPISLTFLISYLFLLAGCSTVSVNIDYDPKVDFVGLRTFAIGTSTNKDDVLLRNPLVLQRVNDSLIRTMQAKGYINDPANPDMFLYPHAGTQDKIRVTDWGSTYHGWWGHGPYNWGHANRIDVREYTEGYLIIDVVSPVDKKLAWRGVGKFIVSSKELSPQESQKRIDEIVRKIFDRYPPP